MARGLGKNRRGFANSSVVTTTTTSVSSDIDLYLPFDSDLNDDSTNSHTISNSGSVAVSTSVKKYGAGSAYFPAAADYLQISGGKFEFGSNDFTIEGWFYSNGSGGGFETVLNYILPTGSNSESATTGNYSYGFKLSLNEGGNFKFLLAIDDGQTGFKDITSGSHTISNNTWTHYAITKEGSTLRAFKDGSLIGTQTGLTAGPAASIGDSEHSAGAALRIGSGYEYSASKGISGYIDDLRIINGSALYTSNFTPPTSAVGLTGDVTTITADNKFLSSVWSLKDQNKKISKGEWIRNDAVDTGANGKGRVIKSAGLQVSGHRHFTGPGITASGGTESTTPTHNYHIFTTPGTFTMTGAEGQVEYLVIGGGGAGGMGGQWMSLGGGGGAGGLRTGYLDPLTPGAYPVTVGQYGTAVSYGTGNPGQPSSFATITSAGGGGGGLGRKPNSQSEPGDAGGSGGGHGSTTGSGSNFPARAAGNTPPTTPPQGNPGGFGASDIPGSYPDPNVAGFAVAGGGGGSGSAGFDGGQVGLGHGGEGTPLPQFPGSLLSGVLPGDSVTAIGPTGIWASGGGAGHNKPGPRGQYMGGVGGPQSTHPAPNDHGQGGGGYGANPSNSSKEGANGTGGGGGGGHHNPGPPGGQVYNRPGERGGNGIVIIRYET